jgi:transposase
VDTHLFDFGDHDVEEAPPYAPEFRRQMIELVRAGRTHLAKEFEPSAQAIRNWVAQADRDEGRREDGLTTVERDELINRLRRDNRQLCLEREILSNDLGRRRTCGRRNVWPLSWAWNGAAECFLVASGLVRSGDGCDPTEGFQFVSENWARYPICCDVPRLGCLLQRLLRLGAAAALCACRDGRRVDRGNPRLLSSRATVLSGWSRALREDSH